MAQREGYLFIDHRASPGFTDEATARRMGAPLGSKLYEAKTKTCAHCGTPVLMNPLRERERHSCWKCSGHYVCDFCAARMREPDYVHFTYRDKIDAILKGR